MPGPVNKSDNQRPILLCCAGPDRSAIAPVVEKAAHLGRAWLVCGVETNTKRLERGIERYGADALYVLCRSKHLGADQVSGLQTFLRRRGIPSHRIMVVEGSPGQPSRLEGALERRMGPRSSPRAAGAIPPAPRVTRVARLGPAETAATKRSRAATRKLSDEPKGAADRLPRTGSSAVRSPRPLATLAKVELVTSPTAHVEAPNAASAAPQPAPPAAVSRQDTDSVPVAPTEAVTSTPVAAASMHAMVSLAPKPSSRWLLAGAAAAVVIGFGTLAVVASGEDAAAAEPSPVVASASNTEQAEDPVPAVATAPAPMEPALSPSDAVAGDAAIDDAVIDDAEVDDPRGHTLEIEGLRRRELRAVDGIVFTATPLPRDVHYLRAEAYCRNLTLSGIGDWRLPTAAEVGTIAAVVELGRTPLWTATVGDPKHESMLVFRGRADEFGIQGRTWRGARALCVRSTSDT